MPRPGWKIVAEVLNEPIPVPGFPGFRASRATVYREMREAGHDRRTADLFAFGRSVTTRNRETIDALVEWPGRAVMIREHPELADII